MNIYDIKKNTIMKKLKYVKLFESFMKEELSPETQKITLDAKIQNNEIPGDLEVPSEPESVTPEGSI